MSPNKNRTLPGPLDGNAVAALLREVFAFDATSATQVFLFLPW